MRITVLGGTGYAGRSIVEEAARRGHAVTSVSRSAPVPPVAGVDYVHGSVDDHAFLARVLEGAEVIVDSTSARGGLGDALLDVFGQVVATADAAGTRLLVIGGAGTLSREAGGPSFIDAAGGLDSGSIPPGVVVTARKLDVLRAAAEGLDWLYVSPPIGFGDANPGERTGVYRVGGDVLLTDADGNASLSSQDLAIGVLDELEQPKHRRRRIHIAD